MPTAYTSIIEEKPDVTFAEFVWRCAHAFAAPDRDDSIDRFRIHAEPLPYHADELAKARVRLAELQAMTPETAEAKAREWHEHTVADFAELRERDHARCALYQRMMGQVEAWEPPTPTHEGIKQFMLDQLAYDATPCTFYDNPPAPMTGAEWLASNILTAEGDVDYHEKEVEKQRQRYAERAAWVEALIASIGTPPQNDR